MGLVLIASAEIDASFYSSVLLAFKLGRVAIRRCSQCRFDKCVKTALCPLSQQ